MTTTQMKQLFKKYDDDYLEFDKVEGKLSTRPDLHCFIVLGNLVSGKEHMVSSAGHDEIWLSIEPKKVAKIATESTILDLIRSGLRYDAETESFAMFI